MKRNFLLTDLPYLQTRRSKTCLLRKQLCIIQLIFLRSLIYYSIIPKTSKNRPKHKQALAYTAFGHTGAIVHESQQCIVSMGM